MKMLRHLLLPFKKYAKGTITILSIKFFAFAFVFTLDSCSKHGVEGSCKQETGEKFRKALELNKPIVGSTVLTNSSSIKVVSPSAFISTTGGTGEELQIYLSFPMNVTAEVQAQFDEINSIESLSNLMISSSAVVQYEASPTNSNYSLFVDTNAVKASLNPLVLEAKQFFYSRGFSEQDIQQMLQEESAVETDLIALVMVVTENEARYPVARNYSSFFISSAQAKAPTWGEVKHCAAHALGVDVMFSLAFSGATSWTKAAMTKAFKTVAKRALGPIGVAIAVTDFSFCLAGIEI